MGLSTTDLTTADTISEFDEDDDDGEGGGGGEGSNLSTIIRRLIETSSDGRRVKFVNTTGLWIQLVGRLSLVSSSRHNSSIVNDDYTANTNTNTTESWSSSSSSLTSETVRIVPPHSSYTWHFLGESNAFNLTVGSWELLSVLPDNYTTCVDNVFDWQIRATSSSESCDNYCFNNNYYYRNNCDCNLNGKSPLIWRVTAAAAAADDDDEEADSEAVTIDTCRPLSLSRNLAPIRPGQTRVVSIRRQTVDTLTSICQEQLLLLSLSHRRMCCQNGGELPLQLRLLLPQTVVDNLERSATAIESFANQLEQQKRECDYQ